MSWARLLKRAYDIDVERCECGGKCGTGAGQSRDQPEQVKQLNLRFAAIEAELASALSRWEQLEAKR